MGRKRKERVLDVYVGTSCVGTYTRAPGGAIAFRYAPDWLTSDKAFAISLSMPLSDKVWTGDAANAYFDGLLPDDQKVRETIAAREHADSAGTFDLLASIGRDCVGALRFVPEGEDPGNPEAMPHRPVNDDEIARRLATLATNPLGMQDNTDEVRISLAGVQEKTAFLWMNQQWQLSLGATPTSHIFKPAMKQGPNGADFSDTPWNEWLCLNLCRSLGLNTANTEVLQFGGKPVIVVERFDRLWKGKVLYRLPQEDMCQALGISPIRKYQSDGGPGIADILDFLNGSQSPREDRLRFMRAQIVFWLLAAIDGHAKNFSIFLTPGGFKLTPLYDVMSVAPYPEYSPHKIKLAMAVGNNRHYRIKGIQQHHFYQTAQKAGIAKQDMDELYADILSRIRPAIREAEDTAARAKMPQKTADAIFAGIDQRARLIEV